MVETVDNFFRQCFQWEVCCLVHGRTSSMKWPLEKVITILKKCYIQKCCRKICLKKSFSIWGCWDSFSGINALNETNLLRLCLGTVQCWYFKRFTTKKYYNIRKRYVTGCKHFWDPMPETGYNSFASEVIKLECKLESTLTKDISYLTLTSELWGVSSILEIIDTVGTALHNICKHSRPISQIPQCTSHISHKAPFCNRNVHMCAHFSHEILHCGKLVWCIVGFVRWVYWVCSIHVIDFLPPNVSAYTVNSIIAITGILWGNEQRGISRNRTENIFLPTCRNLLLSERISRGV